MFLHLGKSGTLPASVSFHSTCQSVGTLISTVLTMLRCTEPPKRGQRCLASSLALAASASFAERSPVGGAQATSVTTRPKTAAVAPAASQRFREECFIVKV